MFLWRRRILRRGLVGVVLWVGRRRRRESVRLRVSLGHGRGALRGIGIGRRVGRVDQAGEVHDARYTLLLFEEWPGCDDHPFPCPSMRRPLCAPTLYGIQASLLLFLWRRACAPGCSRARNAMWSWRSQRCVCPDGSSVVVDYSPSAMQASVVGVRGAFKMRKGAAGEQEEDWYVERAAKLDARKSSGTMGYGNVIIMRCFPIAAGDSCCLASTLT